MFRWIDGEETGRPGDMDGDIRHIKTYDKQIKYRMKEVILHTEVWSGSGNLLMGNHLVLVRGEKQVVSTVVHCVCIA